MPKWNQIMMMFCEFQRKTILADKSLTKDERSEAIRILKKDFDRGNSGRKGIC